MNGNSKRYKGEQMNLIDDLRNWRAERPDEWTMDRFIRDATKQNLQLKESYEGIIHSWYDTYDKRCGDAYCQHCEGDEKGDVFIHEDYCIVLKAISWIQENKFLE